MRAPFIILLAHLLTIALVPLPRPRLRVGRGRPAHEWDICGVRFHHRRLPGVFVFLGLVSKGTSNKRHAAGIVFCVSLQFAAFHLGLERASSLRIFGPKRTVPTSGGAHHGEVCPGQPSVGPTRSDRPLEGGRLVVLFFSSPSLARAGIFVLIWLWVKNG